VGPNQRLLPSSEGLTASVEVKAPRFVNLRFKDLIYEARTGQGKFEIWFLKRTGVRCSRCVRRRWLHYRLKPESLKAFSFCGEDFFRPHRERWQS
jgi:hypothetical protein